MLQPELGEHRVPFVAVEGTAYECGRQYREIVEERFSFCRRPLHEAWRGSDAASSWLALPPTVQRLFEGRAPHILDLYRGYLSERPSSHEIASAANATAADGCTSFGVSGEITANGQPLSGQTKDTPLDRIAQYLVLRMRIENAPTILVLCYPGEILGYGLWSNGMSFFRNSLFSTASVEKGLSLEQWGLLTLAGSTVEASLELAKEYAIRNTGNCLVSDATGRSASIESNAGGVGIIPAKDGIATHANHAEAPATLPYEEYSTSAKQDSQHRRNHLWYLLNQERGHLTAEKALHCLSDHSTYPHGICCHQGHEEMDYGTTAAVVAEPTSGRLYVTSGSPCLQRVAGYEI